MNSTLQTVQLLVVKRVSDVTAVFLGELDGLWLGVARGPLALGNQILSLINCNATLQIVLNVVFVRIIVTNASLHRRSRAGLRALHV